MAGNDDEKLASLCEGCHNLVHFDDAGRKLPADDTDRLLLTRDESTTHPVPEVDLRLKWRKDPLGWDRMSAVQRAAWHQEYVRLRCLNWLRVGKSPEAVRRMLRKFGMTNQEIDVELSQLRKRRRKA